jgi:phosphatidylglycerol:prolipoprotein diacylglycerol transferase
LNKDERRMIQTLAAYVHRLDPMAVRLWGDVGVRWYGLSYLAGFLAAYALVRWLGARGKALVKPAGAADLIVAVAMGTLIGGRLGYCLFYRPELLWDFSPQFPFWGLLALNKGGMASHGGMIGIIAGCAWHARRVKLPTLHLMDLMALAAPIGVFFGRVANFINGELLGRPCAESFALAVKFPQEVLDWSHPGHPKHALLDTADWGRVQQAAMASEAHRIVEIAHRDDSVMRLLEPLLTPRHPSQLYEAALEGLVLFMFLAAVWARPRKMGVVSGWFLVGYAAVRILGEQFRMPDAHIAHQEFAALGVTRGQLLSIVMLLAGLACLAFWSRRPGRPIGGWITR